MEFFGGLDASLRARVCRNEPNRRNNALSAVDSRRRLHNRPVSRSISDQSASGVTPMTSMDISLSVSAIMTIANVPSV